MAYTRVNEFDIVGLDYGKLDFDREQQSLLLHQKFGRKYYYCLKLEQQGYENLVFLIPLRSKSIHKWCIRTDGEKCLDLSKVLIFENGSEDNCINRKNMKINDSENHKLDLLSPTLATKMYETIIEYKFVADRIENGQSVSKSRRLLYEHTTLSLFRDII